MLSHATAYRKYRFVISFSLPPSHRVLPLHVRQAFSSKWVVTDSDEAFFERHAINISTAKASLIPGLRKLIGDLPGVSHMQVFCTTGPRTILMA